MNLNIYYYQGIQYTYYIQYNNVMKGFRNNSIIKNNKLNNKKNTIKIN